MNFKYTLDTLKTICEAEIFTTSSTLPIIEHISTDSRNITLPIQTLFIALVGPNHNGHNYIQDSYDKGIKTFLISQKIDFKNYDNATFLLVSNTQDALQKIAQYHRNQFQIPVIGITGSNGKTIVKDWINDLCRDHFNICKSPKSFNSQIGVPLSVLQLNSTHNLGIFEAGISTTNEMIKLEPIVKPTIGVFTTIGSAHDAGFSNIEEKIQEKLLLFRNCSKIIYCEDHTNLNQALKSSKNTISWSLFNKNATYYFEIIRKDEKSSTILYKTDVFKLHLAANSLIEDALHAICASLELGIPLSNLKTEELRPLSMRLEMIKGIRNTVIIDDSYSNDYASLEIALNFQAQHKLGLTKTLILSDIEESKENKEILYKKIAQLAKSNDIDKIIGIGKEIYNQKEHFNTNKLYFYKNTTEFLAYKCINDIKNEIILIKVARKYQFEKIVSQLQDKIHETTLTINLKSLENNLNVYRSLLKPTTKIMVMVKAFAYGSGSIETSHFLAHNKVDYLAVAYTDEGIELRNKGISCSIMVMNQRSGFLKLLEHDLEPEIYSFKQLHSLTSEIVNKKAKIHLKLDTGMHRLGFVEDEIDELLQFLTEHPNLKVQSIFSHLPSADVPEMDDFTHAQLKCFTVLAQKIEQNLGYNCLKHILNTAGIERFTEYQLDMVRLGIGLYGAAPTKENQINLLSISTLKTTISQIRNVKKGELIGYSGKGISPDNGKIATIAIGYADGYNRKFSNGVGTVVIKGKRYPIIGNVCMDMSMVYIGNDNIEEGDEAIIFGQELPVYELAEKIQTISYEILTNISERVKRIFIYE